MRVSVIVVGDRLEVAHLNLRFGRERNGTENTRQTEHVLTFEERTVAVAIHFNGYQVLTLFVKVRGDVELCQVARVL